MEKLMKYLSTICGGIHKSVSQKGLVDEIKTTEKNIIFQEE